MDGGNGTPATSNIAGPAMAAATYKKIKRPVAASDTTTTGKQPAQALAADPTKPLSPSNPLMVQKADGSVGQWGSAIPPVPASLAKKPTQPSKGYIMNPGPNQQVVTPGVNQRTTPTPDAKKPSPNYQK